MLRTLEEKEKERWREFLPEILHAYNCTWHEATGFSPFYLINGPHPRLPVDTIFVLLSEEEAPSPRGCAVKWASRVQEACRLASENSQSSSQGKRYHDKHLKGVVFEQSDRILVLNMRERGRPEKLKLYWESTVVKERIMDRSVCKVSPETGENQVRTLHCNLLHLVNNLPVDLPQPSRRPPDEERDSMRHLLAPSTDHPRRIARNGSLPH